MMRYWANMAKFGSPNDLEGAGDLPNWEAFNPGNFIFIVQFSKAV